MALTVATIFGPVVECPAQQQRVQDTVHNLSATGPGTLRAVGETEVCVFCHTPHSASGESRPLWNRSVPAGAYTIYESSSMKAETGQPTGASKLCLSCHDGTIALGNVLSRPTPIPMTGGVQTLAATSASLGTDLSNDHPVSFSYSSSVVSGNAQLAPPSAIPPPVRLDRNGEVQCISCHDAHDNSFGDFLVQSNETSALCRTCHKMRSWESSSHAVSARQVPPVIAQMLAAEAGSVADNACANCHRPHNAPGTPWLLDGKNITASCLICHDGSVARWNIENDIRKLAGHGLTEEGIPEVSGTPFLEGHQVSCGDCHNPHAAGSPDAVPAGLPRSLARVAGITREGTATESISYEYELCFRCHGDMPVRTRNRRTRVLTQDNKRLQFQINNPSYHPVGFPGRNSLVPSLIPPLLPTSIITCGDCHSSDQTRRLGGSGPAGPHGSIHEGLLVRRYDMADRTPESSAAYSLCYRCHQRDSILGDYSFREHRSHIVDERTPCSVCHDPHGIYFGEGTLRGNFALINFDLSVVSVNSVGRLEFVSLGTFRGECYLSCHGADHNPESY